MIKRFFGWTGGTRMTPSRTIANPSSGQATSRGNWSKQVPIRVLRFMSELGVMSSTENTPVRLPPPPREVHGGVGCAIWFVRLFILPHMLVGIFLIARLVLTALTAVFGTDRVATVTKAYTSQTSKGGTIYHIDYHYS